MDDIIERLLNVHTLKAIGATLAGYGLVQPAQVDQVAATAGANSIVFLGGLALYALANLIRKA